MFEKAFKKITKDIKNKALSKIKNKKPSYGISNNVEDEEIDFMTPKYLKAYEERVLAERAREPKRVPQLDYRAEMKLRNLKRALTVEEDLFLKLRNHCECGVTFQNSYFIELLLTDGYVDFNEQENNSIRATLESRKKLIRFYKYEPIFGLQLKKGLLDDFELFEEVYFEAIPPDPDKIYAIVFKQNGTEGHLHSEGWRWVERILDEGHDTLCTGMKYLDLEECQNNFSRNDTMLLRKTIAKEDLVEIYAIHPNEHYFERLR